MIVDTGRKNKPRCTSHIPTIEFPSCTGRCTYIHKYKDQRSNPWASSSRVQKKKKKKKLASSLHCVSECVPECAVLGLFGKVSFPFVYMTNCPCRNLNLLLRNSTQFWIFHHSQIAPLLANCFNISPWYIS